MVAMTLAFLKFFASDPAAAFYLFAARQTNIDQFAARHDVGCENLLKAGVHLLAF
jgi:hypothetical protein